MDSSNQIIGKVKLINDNKMPSKFDLYGLVFNKDKGRLRMEEVLTHLGCDVVFYIDEEGYEVLFAAYEDGPDKGLTTDVFMPNQEIKVICKTLIEEKPFPNKTANPFDHCDVKTKLLEDMKEYKKFIEVCDEAEAIVRDMKSTIGSLSKYSVVS